MSTGRTPRLSRGGTEKDRRPRLTSGATRTANRAGARAGSMTPENHFGRSSSRAQYHAMPEQPDGWEPDEDDHPYNPEEDGPEAKAHRQQDEEAVRLSRLLDRFLMSLTLEDRHRHLFTFLEMQQWLLMHKRIPPKRRQ